MSFEKKPRHVAKFSLVRLKNTSTFKKKMQFTFCSNLKVQPFRRKHISRQLLMGPLGHCMQFLIPL